MVTLNLTGPEGVLTIRNSSDLFLPGESVQFTVSGLTPDTEYNVVAFAENFAGVSESSEAAVLSTGN